VPAIPSNPKKSWLQSWKPFEALTDISLSLIRIYELLDDRWRDQSDYRQKPKHPIPAEFSDQLTHHYLLS
jgi:hypothetical protein